MSEVRKCSEISPASRPFFRASGQTGGAGPKWTQEQAGAPPHPKVPLLLPFWCKLRRESTDLVPDLNSLILPLCFVRLPFPHDGKSYLIVIKGDPNESSKYRWELHGWELHSPAQITYTLSQQGQLFKTHLLGNTKQRDSLFYCEISHIECHYSTHDYEFLFSMRELDSPHGL